MARAYVTLTDNTIGYFLSGAVQEGYPLPAELVALGDDDPEVVRGAAELAEYLHVG